MSEARGFLGAGDLYINRIVGGVKQGIKGPFPASKFELKANTELKEQTSRGRNTYGQINESVPVPQPFDLSIEMTQMDKDGLSLALLGTVGALSVNASTIPPTDVVLPGGGIWVPLPKANLGAAIVVQNAAATVTYAENVDYVLNRQMGWIQRTETSTFAAGATVKVSGPALAITGSTIRGATAATVRAEFILDGINFADQRPNIVTVYEAVIASQAAVDFLADDFGSIPLTGRMKTPNNKTEPFIIEQREVNP